MGAKGLSSTSITISTQGKGLYPITPAVTQAVSETLPQTGILHLFVQHTSASLLIQENADPTAKQDLEEFLERLVPENLEWYRHTIEGPDDTTAHMKSALTQTSLTIPIHDGRLALGTWQGIYLWEHRSARHERRILLTVMG